MQLSERQREILSLLAQGKSNKEIAFALSITEGTVKQHLFTLYKKLGVTNRAKAVLAAAAHVQPGHPAAARPTSGSTAHYVWRLVSSLVIQPKRAPETAAGARVRFEQQMDALQHEVHQLAEGLDGVLSVIPGGGLLVCFGLPQSHLDDPARALFLAERVHLWLQTHGFLQASLGLATAAEVAADNAQVLYRGESIDMARALAQQAQPMQVLANEITCRLAGPVARYSPPRHGNGLDFSHREVLVSEKVDVKALAARTPLPFIPDMLANLREHQAMWVAVEGWPPQSSVRLQDAIAIALQAQRITTLRLRLPTDANPQRTGSCIRAQLHLLTQLDASGTAPMTSEAIGEELLHCLQRLAQSAPLALIFHGINTHAALLKLWGEAGLQQLARSPVILVTSVLSGREDSHIAARLLGAHPNAAGKTFRLTMSKPPVPPLGLHADLATLIDTLSPAGRSLIRHIVIQGLADIRELPGVSQELLTTGLFALEGTQLKCRDETVRQSLTAFYVEDSQ